MKNIDSISAIRFFRSKESFLLILFNGISYLELFLYIGLNE